jgi:hypothetical protein
MASSVLYPKPIFTAETRRERIRNYDMPATNPIHQERRGSHNRRIVGGVLAVCVCAAAAVYTWLYATTYVALWRYQPQVGDVIFQSLPHSPVVDAIEGVTRSPYSHCGIVGQRDGRWVVCEAYHGVEETPLREFVFRGRDQGFAVYRLKNEFQGKIPATLECARSYLGRPYDIHYRMDDEKIYCSELIFKAYRDASDGEQLGELVAFGDLNWQPFEPLIRQVESGAVPVERQMITPRDLACADQLTPVFSHALPATGSLP